MGAFALGGVGLALAITWLPRPWVAPPATGEAAPASPTWLCLRGAAERPCRAPREVERLLRAEPLEVIDWSPLGGLQGARRLTLRTPDGVVRAKWRDARDVSSFNDPAGELIAHELQKLVLEPVDHVVPPAVMRCLRPWRHPWMRAGARRRCVVGFLSLWLEGAAPLEEARADGALPPLPEGPAIADPRLYSTERFEADPEYRRAVANVNVLAYLVNNGDAHARQFVAYRRPLHLFLVDHSRAFGMPRTDEGAGRQDPSRLLVPAIPRPTARRLLALTRGDLEALRRTSGIVVDGSRSIPVRPLRSDRPRRDRIERHGPLVDVGLRDAELEALLGRVRRLQRDLRSGRLRVFDVAAARHAAR